jgi:hypothetical protein
MVRPTGGTLDADRKTKQEGHAQWSISHPRIELTINPWSFRTQQILHNYRFELALRDCLPTDALSLYRTTTTIEFTYRSLDRVSKDEELSQWRVRSLVT